MRTLIILSLLISIALFSCSINRIMPISEGPPQNNKDYKVAYLFEHDGCKVYRFQDFSNYVYFTNCNGQVIMTTDSTQTTNQINVIQKKEKK
jgi:hypothetical protein